MFKPYFSDWLACRLLDGSAAVVVLGAGLVPLRVFQ
jgi:hypothetical protein